MEGAIDPVLQRFCQATTEDQANQVLEFLIEETASPLIRKILKAKFAQLPGRIGSDWDFEDVCSSARTGLITRLLRLRQQPNANGVGNLAAYTAKVAYAAWNDYTHTRCPGLTKIRYRLQYLLENRTSQKGFALWEGDDGEMWCGFAGWDQQGLDAARRNARRSRLLEAPGRAAAEAFPEGEPKRLGLPRLTAGLLSWLGTPVELHTLAVAVAEVLEVLDETPAPLPPEGNLLGAPSLVDAQPLPSDEAKWREYLAWLAAEVAGLPLRQRTAFLLHSTATAEFEFNGLLSIRQLAGLLERPVEEVAGLWKALPLDDRRTAQLLGLERQQVINLRRMARDTLGRRWRLWIGRT
ncbi:MAG: hypothetical protein JO015_08960 [Verrucomicrobia bacterium]|nr:hypothetical protein [Verrucomicrobiota bacterium]